MVRFVIVGPNEGKSGHWGGHYFKDGAFDFDGQRSLVPTLSRALSHYSAFPEGSDAHEYAVMKYAALLADETPPPEPPVPPDPVVPDGTEPPVSVFENEKLLAALRSLDPANSDLWTKTDQVPLLSAVEMAYGQGGLNRRMVSEAWPGFDRSVAQAERASADAKAASEAQGSSEPGTTGQEGTSEPPAKPQE